MAKVTPCAAQMWAGREKNVMPLQSLLQNNLIFKVYVPVFPRICFKHFQFMANKLIELKKKWHTKMCKETRQDTSGHMRDREANKMIMIITIIIIITKETIKTHVKHGH